MNWGQALPPDSCADWLTLFCGLFYEIVLVLQHSLIHSRRALQPKFPAVDSSCIHLLSAQHQIADIQSWQLAGEQKRQIFSFRSW